MIDAIVVGAGPAGSSAAATLAGAGHHVLLLDRASFPRDKTCGDAIQAGAVRLLREYGFEGALEEPDFVPIYSWSIEAPSRTAVAAHLQMPKGEEPFMARRIYFDKLVFERAIARGVEFCQAQVTEPIFEGIRVMGVRARQNGETVEWRAPIVIAADGATSVIARSLVPELENVHRAIAIRCYANTTEDLKNHSEFYFPKAVLPGYGWLFPTGRREANIGVGIRLDKYQERNVPLRSLLDMFLDMLGPRIDRATVTEVKSWQLPMGSKNFRRSFDGCLLVGDAGSFVDPLLGAGIYYGMQTGHLAAQVASSALRAGDTSRRFLYDYDRQWKREFAWPLIRATAVQRLIIEHPGLLNGIVKLASSNSQLGR
ncbi:MAG TPA: geranylgeranyl reductase family protein, partial [Aggregatilineales bacterium]|nr:geranylgeranyl reductase family protein [Aggregatilineales bacterium]